MKGQSQQSDLDSLLDSVTRPRFVAVDELHFRLFAEAAWYKTASLSASAAEFLADELRERNQKTKLLYLLDRMRRFSCMTVENSALLGSFVTGWSHLKPDAAESQTRRMDKLAVAWGLDEDAMHLIGNALDLQTRHYARAIGAESGHAKLGPKNTGGA